MTIKEIVLSQKSERDALLAGNYLLRDGIDTARSAMPSGLIKVITGPRRAGKSVFALQMLQESAFAYVNFDDERLLPNADFDELHKALIQVYGDTRIFFFDEIQNLPRWELVVSRLHRRGLNIVLTGSNAHLLSRELATHLTGRFLEFHVFPFSFAEYLRAKGFAADGADLVLKERQGALLGHLEAYMLHGGYPEVVMRGVETVSYLSTLFESILFKDIVRRYNVRFAAKLFELGRYLMTNHGREYSSTAVKNALDFRSVHTVENYIGYLAEAYLLFSVRRFSYKAKEQVKSPRKVYPYDPGLVNAVRFRTGSDTGRLLEGLVAIELMRRKEEFFSYKDDAAREVDFVVRRDGKVSGLLQVCLNLIEAGVKKRELRALAGAAAKLNCQNLMVLTWDTEAEETLPAGQKVRFLPVWRWLLGLC